MRRHFHPAFTLIEILCVIAIIAIFASAIGYAFMRSSGGNVGLRASQSIVFSLVALARSEAALSGRNAALLVSAGPPSGVWNGSISEHTRDRYLRFLVVAIESDDGGPWKTVGDGTFLPRGVHVIPPGTGSPRRFSSELKETGVNWWRCGLSGAPLESQHDIDSSALRESDTFALFSTEQESWIWLEFTPRGTVDPPPGSIALGTTRQRQDPSASPIVFINPDNVVGVAIQTNGQSSPINSRLDF